MTTPAAAEEDERELPIGAIAGVAIVALIIAFVIGMSGGGSSAPTATTGDGFELSTPSGWKAAKIALVPEVGPKPVSIAPPGGAANDGIVAGRNTIAQASLLARGSGAKHVELGAGEAVHVTTQSTSIYVLPTDSDAVIVRCTTAPAVARQCDSVAGSLKLTRGTAVAPGPTDAGAGALGAALTTLASAIRNPQEDLGRAKTARAQATAATDLSRAYRTASTAVTAAPVGALVTGARDQLAKSLKAVGTGWSRYAGAARAGSEAAVSAARSAVARGRLTLGRARTALSAAGYQVGGG